MWIVARYLSVAPFSLKPAAATSSGGKTLLVPTPYAIKMALLDVAIRTLGLPAGERLFPVLRDLSIALEMPKNLVVMKGFSKIRRPVESKDSQKKDETREEFEARLHQKQAERLERGQYPFYSTIAYREYVYYHEPFRLALGNTSGASFPDELPQLLLGMNYFGKRGGFVQVIEPPQALEALSGEQFVNLTPDGQSSFSIEGTLQMLDDCGKSLTLQRANIYSAERVTMGKDRILRHVVLPYRITRSSRSYSWYQYAPSGQREAENG
jgi:hypothetical protein